MHDPLQTHLDGILEDGDKFTRPLLLEYHCPVRLSYPQIRLSLPGFLLLFLAHCNTHDNVFKPYCDFLFHNLPI
jgi:hypothetical protein